jgi:hypothetical protein
MVDMQVIVRHQDRKLCASITCMIRHYVARRAKVIFDHPHNAAVRYVRASERALMIWPIEVVAVSGRPDPVGHVRWLRGLVTERGSLPVRRRA